MRSIMKLKGPELGSLSSRFFAYVQLKKLADQIDADGYSKDAACAVDLARPLSAA